eukprot:TRINITY_DN26718_c0_g1_i1.p1 TRINITY_DN26718_c0_g1~~TRINITY_DN26718_c0_g1_i1.p1  ORF type:complete len:334 (+),score=42.14 TRINITY_DN26718_c0_g1_i1:100-1101(+)
MLAQKLTEALNAILAIGSALVLLVILASSKRLCSGIIPRYSLSLRSRTVRLQILLCIFAMLKGILHSYSSSLSRQTDPSDSTCISTTKTGSVAFVTCFSLVYLFLAHKVHSINATFPKISQRLFYRLLLLLTYSVVIIAPIIAAWVTSGRYISAFDEEVGSNIDVCVFHCPYQAIVTLAVVDLFLNCSFLFYLVTPLQYLANMTHESGELDASMKMDEIHHLIKRNAAAGWISIFAAAIAFASYTFKEFTADAIWNIAVDATSPVVLMTLVGAIMFSTAPAWSCCWSSHLTAQQSNSIRESDIRWPSKIEDKPLHAARPVIQNQISDSYRTML